MHIQEILIDIDYPLWEFQMELPEGLTEELLESSNWPEPTERHRSFLQTYGVASDSLIQQAVAAEEEILQAIFDPNSPFEHAVRTRWYSGVDINRTALIVKDRGGMTGEPFLHVDHRNVFGACILNLSNNPSPTEFHFHGKKIWDGPTQIGKGVIFMNTEHSVHGYLNRSNSDRYICLMNMMLRMDGEYKHEKKG